MLIAGVGNIFLGDDGFGVEVASRLAKEALPDWVRVADYGISGMHLAYDLAEGFERLDRQRERLVTLDQEVAATRLLAARQRSYAQRVLRGRAAALGAASADLP